MRARVCVRAYKRGSLADSAIEDGGIYPGADGEDSRKER